MILAIVAQAYNPRYLGGWGKRIRRLRLAWATVFVQGQVGNLVRLHLKK